MHQHQLTTVCFYSIITANMCQHKLNTACLYSVITGNFNKRLPPYTFTSRTKVSAMFLSGNGDTFMVSS